VWDVLGDGVGFHPIPPAVFGRLDAKSPHGILQLGDRYPEEPIGNGLPEAEQQEGIQPPVCVCLQPQLNCRPAQEGATGERVLQRFPPLWGILPPDAHKVIVHRWAGAPNAE
jgi:hypothetical protein